MILKDDDDFRIFDEKVLKSLRDMPGKDRFIRGMISWLFLIKYILYERDIRFAGSTKYNFKKMISFAFSAIIYFSSYPYI